MADCFYSMQPFLNETKSSKCKYLRPSYYYTNNSIKAHCPTKKFVDSNVFFLPLFIIHTESKPQIGGEGNSIGKNLNLQ